MTKFSIEFKEKIVLDYLNGGGGTHELAKKYGIKSNHSILNWVNQYQKYGKQALEVRSSKRVYDGKFKMEVLEWMWSNRASLSESALHFNISSASSIWFWERKYKEKGVEALFNMRGRPKDMITKHKLNKGEQEDPIEILQHENRMLRIENEYLKKLKALIQEPQDIDKSKR